MKSKSTPSHPSPEIESRKTSPKKYEYIGECMDIYSWKMKPISLDYVEKLGKMFLKWAMEDSDALKVMPFFRKHGHYSTDIEKWKQRSPTFLRDYQEGLEAIGDRREIGGLKGRYTPSMVTFSMPMYDRGWYSLMETKARLSKQEEVPERTVIVIPELEEHKLLVETKEEEK